MYSTTWTRTGLNHIVGYSPRQGGGIPRMHWVLLYCAAPSVCADVIRRRRRSRCRSRWRVGWHRTALSSSSDVGRPPRASRSDGIDRAAVRFIGRRPSDGPSPLFSFMSCRQPQRSRNAPSQEFGVVGAAGGEGSCGGPAIGLVVSRSGGRAVRPSLALSGGRRHELLRLSRCESSSLRAQGALRCGRTHPDGSQINGRMGTHGCPARAL